MTVATDACRGVNLRPDDSATALADLAKAGARLLASADLLE